MMRCADCSKFPFCIKINNPSDVACNENIKRKIENNEVKKMINNRVGE